MGNSFSKKLIADIKAEDAIWQTEARKEALKHIYGIWKDPRYKCIEDAYDAYLKEKGDSDDDVSE